MGKENESKVDYWLTDDGILLLEAWSRDGDTQQTIADKIGISDYTLRLWKKRYPEIKKALDTSREVIDYKVENALLKAALGYTTKEIKVTVGKKIINGETVQLLKETTTREVAPNVNAAMAWLNNRKHDQWKRNRDKVLEVNEEDQAVSITIVRGPKNDDVGENVNQEVKFDKPKPQQKTEGPVDENDKDYWPDDWEDDE